ncbi:MAG: hypothetical protein JXM79_08600 [Sedimentisphaerales bacterium]|nr:hypothetical protein [Sedimentisphaerales bacterium]
MRSISLLSVFLGMVLLLSGCPSAFYAPTIPPVQSPEQIAKLKNPATVKIARDDNVWGGAIPLVIYDGGKEIGQIGPAGAFEWKREAGYLHLRISETTGKVGAIVGQGHPEDVIYEDYQKPGDTHEFLCGIAVDEKVTTWIEPKQKKTPEDIVAFYEAAGRNTIDSYEEFITLYPVSSKTNQAVIRYVNLIDEAGLLSFGKLSKKNVTIIQSHLDAIPETRYVQLTEAINQYYEALRKPREEDRDQVAKSSDERLPAVTYRGDVSGRAALPNGVVVSFTGYNESQCTYVPNAH